MRGLVSLVSATQLGLRWHGCGDLLQRTWTDDPGTRMYCTKANATRCGPRAHAGSRMQDVMVTDKTPDHHAPNQATTSDSGAAQNSGRSRGCFLGLHIVVDCVTVSDLPLDGRGPLHLLRGTTKS